jgi:hypothetical protein
MIEGRRDCRGVAHHERLMPAVRLKNSLAVERCGSCCCNEYVGGFGGCVSLGTEDQSGMNQA